MKAERDLGMQLWNVKRVIALGWHDGATEGICCFDNNIPDVWFFLLAERPTPDGMNDRLFAFSEISPGDRLRLNAAVALLNPGNQVVWAPVWTPDGGDSWDRLMNELEASRGPVFAIVRSEELTTIHSAWRVDSFVDVPDLFEYLVL